MILLRRAFHFILPLLRRLVLVALCFAVVLAVGRGAVWLLAAETHAPGVRGPEVFIWEDDDTRFGGLSALIMAADGLSLQAASDRGTYIAARLARTGAGRVTAAQVQQVAPVALASGRRPSKFKRDIEALTPLPDGRIGQAFEGFARIEILSVPGERPTPTHRWDLFVHAFGNAAFEALATLPDARLLAIREGKDAQGRAQTWLQEGARWRRGPLLPVPGRFRITGADVGPDGCLYVIARRFGVFTGFSFQVHRLSGGAGGWTDEVLYAAPAGRLGNAEGISVWREASGEIVLSLVTDDNFLPLQPTRLIELRSPPGNCDLRL